MSKEAQVRTHRDLEVWKQAMDLAIETYRVTANFPREELYGLAQQARRSAVSIASNIAEGAARSSRKEFIQFLSVSLGSAAELETQALLAHRLGFLREENIHHRITQVRKMLAGLICSLKPEGRRHLQSKQTTAQFSPVTRHL